MKDYQENLVVEDYLRVVGPLNEREGRLNEPASQSSIGQEEGLGLARALAIEPEVILADELTSALSIQISAPIIEKQVNLLEENYTIVVMTYTLRQARRMADYVIFLDIEELVEHGPAVHFFS